MDFEGTTPAGHPPEPIEVGAVRLRLRQNASGWGLAETGRSTALIRPPAHAPVTASDTRQTGITAAAVTDQPDAATVLTALDAATLTDPPYVTVAHYATTEAGIVRRYATACPTLAATPMLDTIRLARRTHPAVANYQHDTLLTQLGIPIPVQRHRALPDAVATAAVTPRATCCWLATAVLVNPASQLHTLAGLAPPQPDDDQAALF
jgi:DNA polymerase III subunit epsilon